MMKNNDIISWLLEGDISIQYQTHRDLLGNDDMSLRKRITTEGWGKQYLDARNENGYWGQDYYQPKWVSTHYTLLDLKNLAIDPYLEDIKKIITKVLINEKGPDGGILPIGTVKKCDVCVNGMALNFSSYFLAKEESLHSVVDFILTEKMADGGFNCQSNRKGAKHSSMHTTISVLEGFNEFLKNGNTYRVQEIKNVMNSSIEFLLIHQLFKSDKTGDVINPNFLKLYYPARWYFDILRALDFFQYAGITYDFRIDPAIDVLISKRTKEGFWKAVSIHPGKVHFEMEKAGQPSKWNTLRVLRVLKKYKPEYYNSMI
jgi:hypothetical protein